MEVMAAFVTLCRGLDAAQIRAAVPAEQTALGLPSAGDPGVVARLLHEVMPGANGASPILPDMIGEAAILKAFSEHYDDDGNRAVLRGFEQAGNQAAATVIRTAQDFTGQAIEGREMRASLEWLDALVEREDVGLDELMIVGEAIRETLGQTGQSSLLVAHAAHVFEAIVDILRPRIRESDHLLLRQLFFAVSNLGSHLGEMGRADDALNAAQESEAIGRKLAAYDSDAYLPDLAMALGNLAGSLSRVGRRQAALGPAQEAVALYRELAAKAPDAFGPNLAATLSNLASFLRGFGRQQEALAAAQEAVNLYRALAAKAPDANTPSLARALANLGIRFREVGQHEAALGPAKEAIDFFRALAATQPGSYLPDLANALHNLGLHLSAFGQRQEALQWTEEAVRTLAPRFLVLPAAFAPWMRSMIRSYETRCEEIGIRPDMELLVPILDVLREMQEGEQSEA